MKSIKRLILCAFLALCFLYANAYNFEVDGIYYNIVNSRDLTCEVTYGNNSYSGSVVVPERVTFDNETYSVVRIGARAFQNCSQLVSIILPDGIEEIWGYAFEGCNALEEINLPQNLTKIDSDAFQYCYALTSVDIPDKVITISDHAFAHCTGLKEIIIPESVTSLGEAAFESSYALAHIELPNTLSEISSYLCKECTSLTDVVIPEGVNKIGYESFRDCSSLTEINIPIGVTKIDDNAFRGNTSLSRIYSYNPEPPTCGTNVFYMVDTEACILYVPKGAKGAYSSADVWQDFYKIREILSIEEMEELYEDLSEEVSSTNNSLEEVWTTITGDYPEVVDKFMDEYDDLMGEIEALLDQINDAYNKGTLEYDLADEERDKIEEINERITQMLDDAKLRHYYPYDFFVDGIYYKVTSDTASTVEALYGLTASPYSDIIIIPATVTNENVAYTVTSVGELPFPEGAITSITLPSSITAIGEGSFANCSSLTTIICEWDDPSSVSASEGSFAGIYSTATLYVPTDTSDAYQSVALWSLFCSMEEYDPADGRIKYNITNDYATVASYQSTDLSGNITIPENVVSKGIVYKVTAIGTRAFYNCSSLTGELTIPNSVTTIGDYAFYGCTSLTQATISAGVTSIGQAAFAGCSEMTDINVSEGNQYYCDVDGVLFSKDMTLLITFPCSSPLSPSYAVPEEVTTLGDYAFADCKTLTSITAVDNVSVVGDRAFSNCSGLIAVVLGETVETIGENAFYYCSSLSRVYSLNVSPPVCENPENTFVRVSSSCILFVPAGSYEAYSTMAPWKDFLYIIEIDTTGIEAVGTNGVETDIVGVYTIDGKRLNDLRGGINIVHYSDGTARKVFVK